WMQFEDRRTYAILALGLLALVVIVARLVESSRFGMSLLAIKQNELAAEAAGIETRKWKLRAIALSGAMAGIAGGFYTMVLLIVTPLSVFGMLTSAQALVVTLFGGVGTVWGPLAGATILVPFAETLHAELGNIIHGIHGVVYGLAIIVIILVAPEGLLWKLKDVVAHRRKASQPVAETTPEAVAVADPGPLPERPEIMSNRTLLEVRNVSKAFGGLKAVQNVSFKVPEGAVIGIIGPNGAGKTTLFNLLNGFYKPDEGEVIF